MRYRVGHRGGRGRGFTLIEMMVVVAVMVVLLMIALPNFVSFRQRAALRSAADQVVVFIRNARFEAIRRNTDVRVHAAISGGQLCLGADLPTAASLCDCSTAGACSIGQFPASAAQASDWRGVRFPTAPSLGTFSGAGIFVFNVKRGGLTQTTDKGFIYLQSPAGGDRDYRLNINVDRNGRIFTCQPTTAPSKLPDFADKPC
jgi:prepilin-type N-terminal cleavage/methylation domain-containing protein